MLQKYFEFNKMSIFNCTTLLIVIYTVAIIPKCKAILIRQSLKEYPLARCTNGLPASYFHSWDFYNKLNKKKYIIFLQPGGYCHNIETCKMRCKIAPYMCVPPTENWMENEHGFLSDDAERNPHFYDYFKVVIPYCSADMYVGRKVENDDTEGFSFLGRYIFVDTIQSLQKKFNIMEADQIVFAGSSAGGAGVAFNCNYLQKLLPNVGVYCVVDGAFFYPRNEAFESDPECDTIDKVLLSGSQLWNAPQVADFKLHSFWWQDVEPPLFISIAGVDQFGFESYCGNESYKTEQASWAEGTKKMAIEITKTQQDIGFFMPACYDHMLLLDDMMFDAVPVGHQAMILSDVLNNWITGEGVTQAWDNCKSNVTFCNNMCPNKVATYRDMKHV